MIELIGKLEQLRNRADWALEILYDNPHPAKIAPFKTQKEAAEHQLEILDAIVLDYIELRRK